MSAPVKPVPTLLEAAALWLEVASVLPAVAQRRYFEEADAALLGRLAKEAAQAWATLDDLGAATCTPGVVMDLTGRVRWLVNKRLDQVMELKRQRDEARHWEEAHRTASTAWEGAAVKATAERDALQAQVQAVQPMLPLLRALAAHPWIDATDVILSIGGEEVEAPLRLTYGMVRSITAAFSTPAVSAKLAAQGGEVDAGEAQALAQRKAQLQALLKVQATCATCPKPATCWGAYEQSHAPWAPACDDCCGHGNEDGHCERITAGPRRPGSVPHALALPDDASPLIPSAGKSAVPERHQEQIGALLRAQPFCAGCGALATCWGT